MPGWAYQCCQTCSMIDFCQCFCVTNMCFIVFRFPLNMTDVETGQGTSKAGLRGGMADNRSSLLCHFFRLWDSSPFLFPGVGIISLDFPCCNSRLISKLMMMSVGVCHISHCISHHVAHEDVDATGECWWGAIHGRCYVLPDSGP